VRARREFSLALHRGKGFERRRLRHRIQNVVTPCLLSASSAAVAPLTFSAGVGAGICLATVSCAASSSIPWGCRMNPWPPCAQGIGVRAVMPASLQGPRIDTPYDQTTT